MKINVTLPFDNIEGPREFLLPEAVAEVAALAERVGFDGGNVTDHPCPSARWLDSGGHYAQDPFVMLSFVAAATRKLRLQTGILVLPYRNPFITARSVATLDVFSAVASHWVWEPDTSRASTSRSAPILSAAMT